MDEIFQKILDDIKSSTKKVKILPSDGVVRERMKQKYEINPASLLGRLLENTGGIIIDNWIRFYGTGEIDFVSRNELFPSNELVIAEDVLGGLFICMENGNIGYFAPDCLELEDMEIHLNQFLYWCLHGDTDTFYMDYRWENWQRDLADLGCNEGVAFYPFLWAQAESMDVSHSNTDSRNIAGEASDMQERGSIESRRRKIIPMDEIIGIEFDFLRQMQGTAAD